jgi:hypothetical protein
VRLATLPLAAAAAAALLTTIPDADAGPLFSLDPRLARPGVRAMSHFTEADGHRVQVDRAFLDREHLYYFAVTATSEAAIDMGILSEVVVVKQLLEGDQVKLVRTRTAGDSPAGEVVASFAAHTLGTKVEIDLTTDLAIRLEGGVYKAQAPARTQDVDHRADRLAYTQLFELANPAPQGEGAPARVTLGLRFYLLERANAGFRPRAYPEADRHRLGFFTHGVFVGAPPAADDYLFRRDLARPIVYTLHPNVPERFRPAVTRGILSWNSVFKRTHGVEPVQVRQGADPNAVPGDPDVNIVYWFPASVPKMYLGQAHPTGDPRTGEIFTSYMLLSQSEFESAVDTTQLGLSIEGPDAPAPAPAPGAGLAAAVALRGGRPVRLVSRREGAIDRRTVAAALADGHPASEVLARIIDWTVPHEAGHSLGLRHNFKSTADIRNLQAGQYCATVMEYLPPLQAPVVPQGYDHAAIAYGYEGRCPAEFARNYMYGTDEDSKVEPDTNTYDLGEPLAYLIDHFRHIRRARPTMQQLADPGTYLGLLFGAVQPLPKFLGVPDDARHPRAVEFLAGVLSDQGSVAASAGGNGGTTSTAPPPEFVYPKNLMERAAVIRAFAKMSPRVKLAEPATARILQALEATAVDAPRTDLFLVRLLAVQGMLAFGDSGKQAIVRVARAILAYAQANPQAPTIRQEVRILAMIKSMLAPPAQPAAAPATGPEHAAAPGGGRSRSPLDPARRPGTGLR